MPQALAPDVNVAIIKYREYLLRARSEKDAGGFEFALAGLLGTLDQGLALTMVRREDYDRALRMRHIAPCKECGADIMVHQDVAPPDTWFQRSVGLVTKPTVVRMICRKCGRIQILDWTVDPVDVVQESPLDLSIIPEPPGMDTIASVVYYDHDYWKWANLVVRVIEDRMRKFREKYKISSGDGIIIEEGENAAAD